MRKDDMRNIDCRDRIDELINRLGINDRTAARLVGIDEASIRSWRTKSKMPSPRSLLKIANSLDISYGVVRGTSPVPDSFPSAEVENRIIEAKRRPGRPSSAPADKETEADS